MHGDGARDVPQQLVLVYGNATIDNIASLLLRLLLLQPPFPHPKDSAPTPPITSLSSPTLRPMDATPPRALSFWALLFVSFFWIRSAQRTGTTQHVPSTNRFVSALRFRYHHSVTFTSVEASMATKGCCCSRRPQW